MIFDLLTVHVFIEKKPAAIHSKDLSTCSFDNHPCGCKPLVGFIGNECGICPSCGNITNVGGSASQVADFTGKVGLIVLVKPGIGEQQAFIVYIFLICYGYLFFTPISGSIGLCMKQVSGCRHIEQAEDGPEILKQCQRNAPDGDAGLEIVYTVDGVMDP